ncbi:MAG UNVERIFIED_CONTAM: carotenoid biosynthesis protein [Anaerolineae bacterium]|jgi:putative membrane protein
MSIKHPFWSFLLLIYALPKILLVMMGLWFAAMMSVPIMRWTFEGVAILWGVYLTTLLQATVVITVLVLDWKWKRTLVSVGFVVVGTIVAEIIGTKTGLLFGQYHYTGLLQPQILDVPILIGFAWLMLLPITWGMAYATRFQSRLALSLYAGIAMTAWDLYLDPQMTSWDLWKWDHVGTFNYFGIPLHNFLGWFVVAGLITWIINPPKLTSFPCLLIYSCVWMMQFIRSIRVLGADARGYFWFHGNWEASFYSLFCRALENQPYESIRDTVDSARLFEWISFIFTLDRTLLSQGQTRQCWRRQPRHLQCWARWGRKVGGTERLP